MKLFGQEIPYTLCFVMLLPLHATQPALIFCEKWFYRGKGVPIFHTQPQGSSEKSESPLAVIPADRNLNDLQPWKTIHGAEPKMGQVEAVRVSLRERRRVRDCLPGNTPGPDFSQNLSPPEVNGRIVV